MREHTQNMTDRLNYLIGVPSAFINDFDRLQAWCPEARQIRCLCALRSKILSRFREFQETYRPYMSLTQHPAFASDWRDLEEAGIQDFQEYSLYAYVLKLGKLIGNRLDCITDAFSDLPSEWIQELFALPQEDRDGVWAAVRSYEMFRNLYPFQKYINWHFEETAPQLRQKNIFRNDAALAEALTDAHKCKRFALKDFVMNRGEVTVICDCENGDAERLYSALRDLGPWVSDVILVAGPDVTGFWRMLAAELKETGVHVYWDIIPRIKKEKSLVDLRMAARACEERFAYGAQSMVLVTSDSDIWALFPTLHDVDIFVLAEKCKVSTAFSDVLTQHEIPHGYMEDMVEDSTYLADKIMRREMDEAIRHINKQGVDLSNDPPITRIVACITKRNHLFFTHEQFDRYVAECTEKCRQQAASAEKTPELRTAV